MKSYPPTNSANYVALRRGGNLFNAVVFAGLLLATFRGRASDPLDTWIWRNPLPTGDSVTKLKYLNGRFFALGQSATVLSSPDGINWTIIDHGTENRNTFTGMAYGNGHFVLSGGYLPETGTYFLTSADGINWEQHLFPSFFVSTYANGVFVAGGYISTDGLTWKPWNPGQDSSILSIAYGKGLFVGVSENTGGISVSQNGSDWTGLNLSVTPGLGSVAFGNGIFVALFNTTLASPKILTSVDGTNWVIRASGFAANFYMSPQGPQDALAFANGRFIALDQGGGFFRSSPDGIHWSETPFGSNIWDRGAACITGGNGMFVAGGYSGIIASSSDGTNWVKRSSGTIFRPVYGLAYGNGRYVAGGNGEDLGENGGSHGPLISSTDGIHWSEPFWVPGPDTAGTLTGVSVSVDALCFVNDRFFASASGLLTSTDGLTWNAASSPAGFPTTYQIIFEQGKFVGVGDTLSGAYLTGWVITSTDGTNWSSKTFGGAPLRGIAYGNGQFVAAGSGWDPSAYASTGGLILTSSNATDWVEIDQLTPSSGLNGVAYGNGRFVAVAGDGTVFVSEDGITWPLPNGVAIDTSDINSGGNPVVNALVYAGGRFVAAGGGSVWSSSDGAVWERHEISARALPISGLGFTYQNGSFWAIGDNGSILESRVAPQIPSIDRALNGPANLTVLGVAGRTNLVEASADLNSWTTLGSVSLTNGVGMIFDPSAGAPNHRFYRAVAR